jgi:hypothetical protein
MISVLFCNGSDLIPMTTGPGFVTMQPSKREMKLLPSVSAILFSTEVLFFESLMYDIMGRMRCLQPLP